MTPEPLSPDQQAIADNTLGDLFVSACAGAGKTHTVVERFIRRSQGLPPNRGMAIVSFSRVAALEVQKRCQERELASLIRFPHFVGTVDSFFIRYLYLPLAQARSGSRIRVLDSWDSIDACVQLRGSKAVKGKGVALDAFPYALPYDGHTVRFDGRRIRREFAGWRTQIENNQNEWERAAAERRKGLRAAGLRTCEDMRVALAQATSDGRWPFVFAALAGRFCEILVDEAQDCDEFQVAVLRSIRDAGVRLVLVADVDQAIYEFRKARPAALLELAAAMPRLGLRGNRRGSPAICAVSNSMVPTDRADTCSVGKAMKCDWPVRVIPYAPGAEREAGTDFSARADDRGCKEKLVVAHSRSLALKVAGWHIPSGGPRGMAVALMRSAMRVTEGAHDARALVAAIRDVELILLERLGVQVSDQTVEDICRVERIERRWLRASVVALLRAVSVSIGDRTTVTLGEAVDIARSAAESLAAPPGRAWMRSARTLFKAIAAHTAMEVGLGRTAVLPHEPVANTVHGVKGEGADAVLFVLSADVDLATKLLTEWRGRRMDDEANRVAYVGVTRAKRFLALAVPAALSNELLAILKERAVGLEEAPTCRRMR